MVPSHDETATRVWAGLRAITFDLEDRKREACQALDLSFARVKALLRLASEPATLRTLAQDLLIDPPYTTVVVDDLERRGLVTRTVAPEDKRTKVVTVTASGRAAAEQAQRILDRPAAALLALPPGDLAELDRVIAVLLGR